MIKPDSRCMHLGRQTASSFAFRVPAASRIMSSPSHQLPVLLLQQQPVVHVGRGQHLGANHTGFCLSAQRLCRPRQLLSVRRIQWAAELQRQPQSQSPLRLWRCQQQWALPAGWRGELFFVCFSTLYCCKNLFLQISSLGSFLGIISTNISLLYLTLKN